ncbi:MAG: bifunctional oligoribonuclease/PAP phosphatase NrnA [bacterium]|nr:bifunctional oligoribonuclease/PAP phosphatase NrnA [bacterium]
MEISQQILKGMKNFIKKSRKIAVVTHINPDGDAIGSALAILMGLQKMGKEAVGFLQDSVPDNYSFLPKSGTLRIVDSIPDEYDALVSLDVPELDRLGKFEKNVSRFKNIVNIDHHICNANYGSVNLSVTSAAATAELVYELMKKIQIEIDYEIALCIYTGIVTDTGSFQYRNTTSETHRIVAELMEKGIKPEAVTEEVYEAKTLSKVKLLGLALETMSFSADGQIGWLWVTKKMKDEIGSNPEDTEGFVDYARSVKGVKVAVFFEELEGNNVKMSIRSKIQHVDVNKIAHKFGGGGHPSAAGAVISGTPNEVEEMLVKVIKIEFEKREN